MAISQSLLTEMSYKFQEPMYKSMKEAAIAGKMKSAFLCHSHKDEVIVKGLIEYFRKSGINLYIDWQDNSMPDTPNVDTAKKIKDRIKQYELFFFLATSNSKSSRWCPWEIGYADSSNRKIYIIPTSDNYQNYGNEYLELYKRIDKGTYNNKTVLALFEVKNVNGKLLTQNVL